VTYQEFEKLLNKLYRLRVEIMQDSDGTISSNWNCGHVCDETIQLLESNHPRMTKRYYQPYE